MPAAALVLAGEPALRRQLPPDYVRARIPALRVGAPLSFWTEQDVLLPASRVGAWALGGVIYFAPSTAKRVISHAGMHGVRRR